MLSCIGSLDKKGYNNLWQKFFPDQLEKLYIIMKDRTIFEHSSQDEVRIDMNIGLLEKRLKEKNYNIKEIGVVIHNHRRNKNFTREDHIQYWMLKSYGFDGQFLIYCHRTNKTYDIEDENKSN